MTKAMAELFDLLADEVQRFDSTRKLVVEVDKNRYEVKAVRKDIDNNLLILSVGIEHDEANGAT